MPPADGPRCIQLCGGRSAPRGFAPDGGDCFSTTIVSGRRKKRTRQAVVSIPEQNTLTLHIATSAVGIGSFSHCAPNYSVATHWWDVLLCTWF